MSSVTHNVSVACHIPSSVFTAHPMVTDEVIKKILSLDLLSPLMLDGNYVPARVSLTNDRIKQTIKETCTRDRLRDYKDRGLLSDDKLDAVRIKLSPLEEMLHFFWRKIAIVRSQYAPSWGESEFRFTPIDTTGVVNVEFKLNYR